MDLGCPKLVALRLYLKLSKERFTRDWQAPNEWYSKEWGHVTSVKPVKVATDKVAAGRECDGSENPSESTIHPDISEVPISLCERFRVVVHIVCRYFVHSASEIKSRYAPTQVNGQPELA